MIAPVKAPDFARLREHPEAIDWTERKQLVRVAAEAIANDDVQAAAMELLLCLAADPKWEVRHEVALHLPTLPDGEFARLADRLTTDCNAFVRQAAERAAERRRQLRRQADEREKESKRLARDLRNLEAEIGTPAMARVMDFCRRQNEQFVRGLVHELRNIVTSLKLTCDSLASESTPSVRLARLRHDATLLENTVNDVEIFTLSAPTERRCERLRDVILSAVDVARENVWKHQPDVHSVEVQVDVCEAIVLPMARHLVLMALANVIKNAYEAFVTGDGLRSGTIRIEAECVEDAARVTIADDGIGMSKRELAEVTAFQPGRRNKRKRCSTGYGLPIAARNLAAHGGAIAIDSRENVGTIVTITLPLTCDHEEEQDEHRRLGRRRRSAHRRGNRGRS